MTATVSDRADNAQALADEIDWLRSFGWDKARIARRLNVTVSCVEKHLAQETQR